MDAEQQLRRHFKLGDFKVIPDRNVLIDGETEQKVAPKAMAVLMALIRRHPDTVSRKHIIATVWGDQPDGDELLTAAVANLRGHFHDTVKNPLYIETVSKKGYRLLASVALDLNEDIEPEQIKSAHPLVWLGIAVVVLLAALSTWWLLPPS